MKNRTYLFSLLGTLLCLVFYQLILIPYLKLPIPWLEVVISVFLPVLLSVILLHLYFLILTWRPIEKLINRFYPNHQDSFSKDLVVVLAEIFSEEREKQNNLISQMDLYSNIISHLEEGILLIDQPGRIILNNLSSEVILNFQGSIRNKFYWEILQSPDVKNKIKESLVSRQKQSGEFSLYSPMDRTVAYSIIPLGPSFQTREEKLIMVLVDTTRIKKLEKVRTDFVTNVSHEIKSPLGAIIGYIETLIDDPPAEKERQLKFLSIILKNSLALDSLVDDLLVLSKLENNQSLEMTTFYPAKLLDEIIELYQEKIKEQSITLTLSQVENNIRWSADKMKMRQLLINLLDNAIKYSKTGGTIELVIGKVENKNLFSITDYGDGIPLLEQDRIFERFYRVDKSRSSSTTGTGLGLSIVKHIVELHHGTITLSSKRGMGTKFIVLFPDFLTES